MLKDKENTRKQGDAGLGAAIAWFTSQGNTVCIPLTESQKYDLIVDNSTALLKVQVKTTYYRNKCGNFEVLLKTCGGNKSGHILHLFDNRNADLLFILVESGEKYLIPTAEISNRHTITLAKKYNKFKI